MELEPKEKAQELFNQHYEIVSKLKLNNFVIKALAKLSAFVSIDESIKIVDGYAANNWQLKNHLLEVKKELMNL